MNLSFIIAQVVATAVVMGVLIVVAYLWAMKKRYPLNVLVIEYRGAAARLRHTKARRTIKNGKEAIELKDPKDYVIPLDYLDTLIDEKGKTWYILIQHAPKEYAPAIVSPSQPVVIETDEGPKKVPLYQVIPRIDASQKMAYAEALEMSYNVYHEKTLLEKAMPFIYMGIIFVTVVAAMQIMSGTLSEVAKTVGQGMSNFGASVDKFTEVANKLMELCAHGVATGQIPTTPPKPPA